MSSENNEEQVSEEPGTVTTGELPLLSEVFPALVTQHVKDWPKDGLDEERLQIASIKYQGLRWYNIEQLRNAEMAWLEKEFKLNPLHLEDIGTHLQRPKIDDYEDYLFLVLHFPLQQKRGNDLRPGELKIVLGPDYVITIHDGSLICLKKMFELCQKDPQECRKVMSRTSSFLLYSIIDQLIEHCFPIIDNLADTLELIEEEIFKGAARTTIYFISTIRREIIAFRRIFKPQISILATLERHQRIHEAEDLKGYFSDLSDHISKIWDNLEEFKEIIEGLSATYDSLTSHRLNEVIKTLTIISVILLPMTVITGIYGMNVPIPWQEQAWAFGLVMALLVISSVGLILFFRSRRWL